MASNKETWKPIDGFQNYEVSDLGRIRNRKTGRILKQAYNTRYLHVTLSKNGKLYTFPAHRVVAKAFIPNPDGLPVVMHIDDNPENNAVSNLMCGTQKQNMNWNDIQVRISRSHGGTPVKQFTKDGKFVAFYDTGWEASRKTGIAHSSIFFCLRGKRKTAGGFVWKRL